jgi:carboxylate-amine ligase
VFSRVVGQSREGFKPELFECLVELTTPVLPDAEAALVELRRLREELSSLTAAHYTLLYAAGAHALARGPGQPIVPLERYERLAAALGRRVYRQLVCGLHVHVSVPDPETCLRAFEGVVPWLPTLLALSANSPFADGRDTGRRSERAERLLEMPTGGTPPILRDWADWTAATRGDDTRRHWDAWPRPEYGTLEVRVADMQTDVRRSAGFAAIVQALVAAASDEVPEAYDRNLYARRRARAADEMPDADEVRALAALVEPVAGPLGGWPLAEAVLSGRPEAERQLAVAAAGGIAAIPRDVVGRSLE